MEMPKPGEGHSRLEKLTGIWEGTEIMHPSPWSPKKSEAHGRVENRKALDGFNVIQEYTQKMGGVVTFRGHGVFSYDQASKGYTMHWWDNMGTPVNVYTGNFEGEVLTLRGKNPMGHSKTVFDMSKSDGYEFRMEFSQDGKEWVPFMEGSYTKKS